MNTGRGSLRTVSEITLLNLVVPGLGFALFYSLLSASSFILIFMALSLAVVIGFSYSTMSISTLWLLGAGAQSLTLLASLLFIYLRPPTNGRATKTRIRDVAISLALLLLLGFFGQKLTRLYFTHTIINQDTESIASVIPKGECGYIKLPVRDFKIQDLVAYTHESNDSKVILVGRIQEFTIGNKVLIEAVVPGQGLDSQALGPIEVNSLIGMIAEVSKSSPTFIPLSWFTPFRC